MARLTAEGLWFVEDPTSFPIDPFTGRTATDGGLEVRRALERLRLAADTVAESGTPEQADAAVAVLSAARRSIYLVLADQA